MIRDADGRLGPSREVVGDMPGVLGYRRNEDFVAQQWLYEDTFNWGNQAKRVDAHGNSGSRSVMYVALRLMFYLGVRRLYLLGCDFRMETGKANYAFPQDRSDASVRSNNRTYQVLNSRLGQLLPYFEREDYRVFNCTPQSGLKVFPHVPYEDALAEVCGAFPKRIVTAGMYDREARQREAAKQAKAAPGVGPARPAGPAVPAAAPAAARPPTEPPPAGVPPLTLVVAVDAVSVCIWSAAWSEWYRAAALAGQAAADRDPSQGAETPRDVTIFSASIPTCGTRRFRAVGTCRGGWRRCWSRCRPKWPTRPGT